MRIILLRHGPAGDKNAWAASGKPDFERPLTAKGRKKTEAAAAGLRRVAGKAGRVASSPLARAWETAALAAAELDMKSVERFDELAPDAPPEKLLRRLQSLPPSQTVVLVGHEPALSSFAALLTGGGSLELKKAGACELSCEGRPDKGEARLTWLLAPRQLRRLA